MRILCIEQFSELGGGQQCLLDLLPAIRERGWTAIVAAPGKGPLFDRARAAGAETAAIELGPYTDGSKTAGDGVRFAMDTVRLQRWVARQNADVIYSSAPRPLVAAALGARGRPTVFHAQHFLGKQYAVSVAGWAIRRARATVIADARYVGAQFTAYTAPERRRVVYNGVAEIPFVARKFGSRREWRIGIIGRIAPMKGQADFLRAAALLPPGMRFVICGAPMFSSDGYAEQVVRLAAGLPVDFLGWRDDVGAVFGELDLLVVPSTAAEATTRVILEAFSAGVPVVAYEAGGIPEIIRDGENGFLVPEREPHALARKIREITALDLTAVVARARADWEQKYTLQRYRDQMLDVIATCRAS